MADQTALEVLRDHRDVLRRVVDPPGLTKESEGQFFGWFCASINRTVIGPQRERHQEMLALLASEVVRLGPGPKPDIRWDHNKNQWMLWSTELTVPCVDYADFLVAAYSPAPTVSTNPVIRALVEQGRLRPRTLATAELGSNLTQEGRVINTDGSIETSLFVLGPLAEGSSYYNHYVLSPRAPSRALTDADRVVTIIMEENECHNH